MAFEIKNSATSSLLSKVPFLDHAFLDAKTHPQENLFYCHQVHGTDILKIDDLTSDSLANIQQIPADGLITTKTEQWLGIKTADCMPILIADTDKKIIAAIHAGWKGLLNGIVLKALQDFLKQGSDFSQIVMAIGPSIGQCCFEVSPEIIEAFESQWGFLFCDKKPWSKSNSYHSETEPSVVPLASQQDSYWLSLQEIATKQCTEFGLLDAQIDSLGICTYCGYLRKGGISIPPQNHDFASYRRAIHSGLSSGQRQWSIIRSKG